MTDPGDLNDLRLYALVVEHGGFSAAARASGAPKSRLSRRVQALEQRLGVQLLQRSSRRFSVTAPGQAVFERCQAMLAEAHAAAEIARASQEGPRGLLRVTCPVALLNGQLAPVFARFLMRYPAVTLDLESTNRRVDVIGEGLDVAIRVRFPPLQPSGLVMRRLDDSPQHLVAAPALGVSVSAPEALAAAPALDLRRDDRGHVWTLRNDNGDSAQVRFRPRFVTDDMAALRAAALAGAGVVQLPAFMIWRDLAAGDLAPVLPASWRPESGVVHAVFSSRRGLSMAARALLDFLAEQCAAQRRESGAEARL